jgi:hypothetical protein
MVVGSRLLNRSVVCACSNGNRELGIRWARGKSNSYQVTFFGKGRLLAAKSGALCDLRHQEENRCNFEQPWQG